MWLHGSRNDVTPSARESNRNGGQPRKSTDALSLRRRKRRGGRPSAADAELIADHILEAGWQLLLEDGFERFSFDRLARAASVGKPTIYSRFTNKQEYLRALLEHRLTKRQNEVAAMAIDLPFKEGIALLASYAVNLFLSPEGRLIDRLIDWVDNEGGVDRQSVRSWAARNGVDHAERIMQKAQDRGEVTISDIPTCARFLVEGVIGHARMSEPDASLNGEDHLDWAERYCAMLAKAFS